MFLSPVYMQNLSPSIVHPTAEEHSVGEPQVELCMYNYSMVGTLCGKFSYIFHLYM